MLLFTGDESETYGIAQQRDPHTGELIGLQIGMTREQALEAYDNFQGHAVLKVSVEVLSAIDGEITQRKETT